jgi:hypothetical protein
MPGQPKMRKLTKYIEDRGGDQWIMDRIAAGESVGKICKSIILPGDSQPISRPFLYTWRNKRDERRVGWQLAMQVSADAHAEMAGDILDDLAEELDPSSAQVSLAKSRSEYKRWLARVRDRDKYGEEKQQALNVNILTAGDLHIDGLRRLGARPEPEAIETVEVELLEEGHAESV